MQGVDEAHRMGRMGTEMVPLGRVMCVCVCVCVCRRLARFATWCAGGCTPMPTSGPSVSDAHVPGTCVTRHAQWQPTSIHAATSHIVNVAAVCVCVGQPNQYVLCVPVSNTHTYTRMLVYLCIVYLCIYVSCIYVSMYRAHWVPVVAVCLCSPYLRPTLQHPGWRRFQGPARHQREPAYLPDWQGQQGGGKQRGLSAYSHAGQALTARGVTPHTRMPECSDRWTCGSESCLPAFRRPEGSCALP